MTALLITAAVIAGVAAYVWAGVRYVMPRAIKRGVEDWLRDCPDADAEQIASWRRFEQGMAWLPVLVWPFYVLYLLLHVSEWHGPELLTERELRQQQAAQQKHIAELERELGIGRQP